MKRTEWKLFFADWALLFGAVYASLRCLQTAFSLPWEPTLWAWTLLLVGAFNLLFRLDHAGFWALGALLLAALLGWLFRSVLTGSLRQLVQSVANQLAKGYPWIEQLIPSAELPQPRLLPGLIAVAAALGFLLCLSVVWLRTVIPGVLWCAVAVMPCFFLTDTPPSVPALICLCACLLILIFSHASRVHAPGETVRTMLFALLPTAMTLGLLLLCFPEKGYAPPLALDRLRAPFLQLGDTLVGEGHDGTRHSTREVSLRELDGQPDDRYTVIELRTDEALVGELMYLRGTAYEEFDGECWRVPAKTPEWTGAGSPLDAEVWTVQTALVQIRTVALDDVLYTPPELVSVGYPTVYDYYVPNPDALRSYEFEVWLNSDQYAKPYGYYRFGRPEEQVRAGRDCLYLPEETREALLQIASERGLTTLSYSKERIQDVCELVQSGAAYSLQPEACPEDADFCVWFLTEAKSGYCVHFASAATAMFRALGIPARYVEGYVTVVSEGMTRVAARQAHAWVEVCVDGIWQRVDPTPSDGLEQIAVPVELPDMTEPAARPDETPAQTRPSAEATEPVQPDESPTAPTQEAASSEETVRQKGRLWLLLIPAGLAAGVTALLTVRHARRRRISRLQGNALGLWYYRQYCRMCRICRQTPAQDMLALAQKARFSQHLLTEEELAVLHGGARKQLQTLRRQRGLRRLWYYRWKTILCIGDGRS